MILSSFAMEREVSLHNYQGLSKKLELRARYQLPASTFVNDPVLTKRDFRLIVHSYDPPAPQRLDLPLNRRLLLLPAAAIWDHGYDSIPKVITSEEGQVFS
jgi:hypothetical protein